MPTYREVFLKKIDEAGYCLAEGGFILEKTCPHTRTSGNEFIECDDCMFARGVGCCSRAWDSMVCTNTKFSIAIDFFLEHFIIKTKGEENMDGQSYVEKILGVGKNQELISNKQGGKQSKSEYAFHLIPAEALLELAKVFEEGSGRYARDNWKRIEAEEHFNHMMIHYYAAVLGDTQDNHLGHFLCRAVMCFYMMTQEMEDSCS